MQRYRQITLFTGFAWTIACLGCQSASKTAKVDKPIDSKPYQWEQEGRVPPLDPTQTQKEVDRAVTVEDLPVEEAEVAVEDVEVIEAPAVTDSSSGDRTYQGYRIQVFASGSQERAESVRQAIEIRLDAPAYIESDQGVFRVRVGDCMSREAAEALLERVRQAGYADAWIANTQVKLPKKKTG